MSRIYINKPTHNRDLIYGPLEKHRGETIYDIHTALYLGFTVYLLCCHVYGPFFLLCSRQPITEDNKIHPI